MPRGWVNWKIRYILKTCDLIMKLIAIIGILVIVVGAVSVFAISPYFTESTIDEAIPTGALVQSKMDSKDAMIAGHDGTVEEEMMKDDGTMEEEMMKDDGTMEEEMMKDDGTMEEEMMKDDGTMEEEMMKDDGTVEEEMMKDDGTMKEEMMKDDGTVEEEMMKDDGTMEEEMMESIPMSYAGSFVGVGDGVHDAQGDAYTIPLEDTSNVLRLENFKSTNGPDLYVYLSTDENASDFVNLGALKANNGNQNYEIPDDTDLSKYNKVLIWCKAFGVLFGSAELSTQ